MPNTIHRPASIFVSYSAVGEQHTWLHPSRIPIKPIREALEVVLGLDGAVTDSDLADRAADQRFLLAPGVDEARNSADLVAGKPVKNYTAELDAAQKAKDKAAARRGAAYAARDLGHRRLLEVVEENRAAWATALRAQLPSIVQRLGTALALLREASADSVQIDQLEGLRQRKTAPQPLSNGFHFSLPTAVDKTWQALEAMVAQVEDLTAAHVGEPNEVFVATPGELGAPPTLPTLLPEGVTVGDGGEMDAVI